MASKRRAWRGSDGGRRGQADSFEAHALSPSCPVGAAIPSTAYDLGEIFEGLAVTSKEQVCNAPPQGAPIESGPTKPVGYLDVSYGECSNPQGDGCSPPVDVQSWPECARNPNSYSEPAEAGAGLALSEAIVLAAAPQIPAASLEGGKRIEIYTGPTTVVVFASDAALAKTAANALAAAAVSATSGEALRAEAAQPGDASTCTNLLPAGS